MNKAAAWIRSFGGQQELDFNNRREKEVEDTKRLLNNIDNILIYCCPVKWLSLLMVIYFLAKQR